MYRKKENSYGNCNLSFITFSKGILCNIAVQWLLKQPGRRFRDGGVRSPPRDGPMKGQTASAAWPKARTTGGGEGADAPPALDVNQY